MSGTGPMIGVNIFKDLINEMKNELKTDLGSKIDDINARLNTQDKKINDLGQRVKNLKKHITYADAARSPPKPPPKNTNITNTQNSTATNTNTNTYTNTKQHQAQAKNHDLTAEEICRGQNT